MKNVLISGLVIGSLIACPIVLADTPEQKTEQAQPAAEPAKPVKKAVKRSKKGKRHHRKHHAENCGCPEQAGKHHSQKRVSSTSSETPAEHKIDEETELTNR